MQQQSSVPLSKPVKFWFQSHHKQSSDFAHSLLPITTAQTLSQFWSCYQHLRRPSHIQQHHNLYLFSEGIAPLWEDNKNGGCLSLYFDKHRCDRVWEDILLAFVSCDNEVSKLINGIRLKVRKDVASIEVWVGIQQSDKDRFEGVRKWLVEAAGVRDDTHVQWTSFC